MTNRSHDWFAQAGRDLEQARSSETEKRHEWACEHYGPLQSREAIEYAGEIIEFVRVQNQTQVEAGVKEWVEKLNQQHPELRRVGYFGSYARGDWGVGSDLDVVIIVDQAAEPFERRALRWDLSSLPVPAELLVYTETEWQRLQAGGGRFAQTLARETVWLYPRERVS
ncbi:MAG: nucleotidyltransferase domain-containing protein [Chloroflexota bacterium]